MADDEPTVKEDEHLQAEAETALGEEEIQGYMKAASDALGMDLGKLLEDMMSVTQEDLVFRQAVLSNQDVLLDNQRKLHGIMGTLLREVQALHEKGEVPIIRPPEETEE